MSNSWKISTNLDKKMEMLCQLTLHKGNAISTLAEWSQLWYQELRLNTYNQEEPIEASTGTGS